MSSYVYIKFDESITYPEYKIYKSKLIKSLEPYFTNVLTTSFNPNVVGKTFSVHLSLGNTSTNQNRNHFYRYLSYKTPFPDINQIISALATLYKTFRTAELHSPRTNVIVFDMDETLIDSNTKPFYKNIFNELIKYKDYFQYIILWTHGTTSYLSEINLDMTFDLYMSRNTEDSENKGLGAVLRELNRSHSVEQLDFCVLIDDSAYNYDNDYDLFVHVNTKPSPESYTRTLSEIVYCMNRYYQKRNFPRQINLK